MKPSYIFLVSILSMIIVIETTLLNEMRKKPELSKFVEKSTDTTLYTAKYLAVLAPNNEAMGLVSKTDLTAVIKNHFFPFPFLALTENWINLQKVLNSKIYSTISNLNDKPIIFYKIDGTYYVNHAKVILADQKFEDQVFHIIDRVLEHVFTEKVLNFMTSQNSILSVKFKKSSDLIKKCIYYSDNSPTDLKLKSYDLDVSMSTWFVPIDDAWNSVSSTDFDAMLLNNITIENVMNNYFVFNELIYLRDQNLTLKLSKRLIPAQYFWVNNKGYITVNGYTAEVVQSNYALPTAVIHYISQPLISFETVEKRLNANYKYFMTLLEKVPNYQSIFSSNASIAVMSEAVMNQIAKLSPDELVNIMMSLLIKDLFDSSPAGKYMTIQGNNSFVYLRIDEQNHKYLDYPLSTENPYQIARTLKITSSTTLIGGIILTVEGQIDGVVSCHQLLPMLNRLMYSSQLNTSKISLEAGSPYVVLAPSTAVLSNFLSLHAVTTVASTSVLTNQTTTTQAPTNQETTSSAFITQLVLQRMLLPIELNYDLWTKSQLPNKISVPTMNYAVLQERITLDITTDGAIVKYNDQKDTNKITAYQPGYRCYGSDKYSSDRSRDILLYPVDFILSHSDDSSIKQVCLVPPCNNHGNTIAGFGYYVLLFCCSLIALLQRTN